MKKFNLLLLFLLFSNSVTHPRFVSPALSIKKTTSESKKKELTRSNIEVEQVEQENALSFDLAQFNYEQKILYLADTKPNKEGSNIVASAFGSGVFYTSNLGNITEKKDEGKENAARPLKNKAVKQILSLNNKDLLVVLDKENDKTNSRFYIIHDPQPDRLHLSENDRFSKMTLITSEIAKNIDGVPSNILACYDAGKDKNGYIRIAVVIAGDPNHQDLLDEHSPEKGLIRFFSYDLKTITDNKATAKIDSDVMTLKTSDNTKPNLGSLTGIIGS